MSKWKIWPHRRGIPIHQKGQYLLVDFSSLAVLRSVQDWRAVENLGLLPCFAALHRDTARQSAATTLPRHSRDVQLLWLSVAPWHFCTSSTTCSWCHCPFDFWGTVPCTSILRDMKLGSEMRGKYCTTWSTSISATYFGPKDWYILQIICSSWIVHPPFFMFGRRWLRHRSRHCLPFLDDPKVLFRSSAISFQWGWPRGHLSKRSPRSASSCAEEGVEMC